ncbi:MIP/aquaporin family protein [Pedobacter panaciterrae]|jgi:MIP family channel proteins|uniref:MIP/aquaporin family protein n=1 Tax=Pedobacter panaciterrae TaxID=363849 RepID=A0ABU8NQK1_9SPHI|nr:MIP/aquaporin family protein [Pedobacter panaciterrae]NQX55465.1 aquaporin family protein [Pedobacter panaciterrae]
MSAFSAEILGTMFMILLGNGVVANVVLTGTKGNNGGWMVITTAWALAVFVGVVIAGPYSGAHLNPAVTIGLAIAGKFNWADAPTYIAAQFIGAMLGSFLVWLLFKDFYRGTADKGAKQATFCTAPAIPNTISNLISEIIGTFVLIFVIFHFTDASLGADKSPIGLGSVGALPVTFLVWVIGLSLGGTTGYAINPARDLGPRIMHAVLPVAGKGGNNWNYAWIPVIGPIIGCSLAALLYLCIKV